MGISIFLYLLHFACPNYKFTQFKQTAFKCKQNSLRFLQESRLTNQTGKRSKSTNHCIAKSYWHRIPIYNIIDSSLSVSRNRSRLDSPALQLYFWPLPADACRALCGLRQNEWGKEVPFQPVPKLSEAPLTDMRCFSKSKLSVAVPKSQCQESRIKQHMTCAEFCCISLIFNESIGISMNAECLWRSA